MATLVGTQENFIKALQELLEFEFDVKEAYAIAINKISTENYDYKAKLTDFLKDHETHIIELTKFLNNRYCDFPDKSDLIKGFLSKGKVYLANLTGDDNKILAAMASNEVDVNLAYARMNARHDSWEECKQFFKAALAEEKKHKDWLDKLTIAT